MIELKIRKVIVRTTIITCDKCKERLCFNDSQNITLKVARSRGWTIDASSKNVRCPKCAIHVLWSKK